MLYCAVEGTAWRSMKGGVTERTPHHHLPYPSLPCLYIVASCCAVLSFFGVIILMVLGMAFDAEVEVGRGSFVQSVLSAQSSSTWCRPVR